MASRRDYSYRNLDVWQQAQELAVKVIRALERVPQGNTTAVLTRQLVAAVSSIAANIAEGHGRYSRAAYRNHLSIARGSLCEADSWLDLLRRLGHLPETEFDRLHEECNSLLRILTAKMRSLERALALREEAASYVVEEEEL